MRKASSLLIALAVLLIAATMPAAAQEAQQQEKPKETAALADPISGTWEGTISMQDGPMPFFMTLKLDQDKVTGEIGNSEGTTSTSGTWADGKLKLSFTYRGPMTLSGSLKDDQLAGELIFSDRDGVIPFTAKKKA